MRAAFEDFDGLASTPPIEALPKCAFHPILVTVHARNAAVTSANGNGCNNDDHDIMACCKAGAPILYVLPARMDFDVIPSELYTKAMAYYCLLVHQSSVPCCSVTVLMDVRAGRGWPNMFVTRMLTWVRPCCATMHSYFPGALRQVIVYPMPSWAMRLWRLVQPLLPTHVQSSVTLVAGTSTSHSAPYPDQLEAYVSPEILQRLEDERTASFS
jgi:CRAL/TRIO domain